MSMRRNTIHGALGFLIPTLVVFAAYPVVLRGVGGAALGIYILASTLSGSLAFLEFGLSTATMKFVAEEVGANRPRGVAEVVNVSLVFYGTLGFAGLLVVWLAAPALARWSRAPPELAATAILVFRIAAVQFVPAYVLGVFGAVFKGLQRFEYASVMNSLLTALTWGGGVLAVMAFRASVAGVALVGLAATTSVCALSAVLAVRLCRRHKIALGSARPTLAVFRSMTRFGAFMSVNGLLGLLAGAVQSWLIAGLLTPVAVTIYSSGVQIVSKINQLMGAMFEAMMPVAATMSRGRDAGQLARLRRLYRKTMGIALALSVGGSAVLYAVARVLIHVWLRSDIDADVAAVVRVMCLGLAINGATPVVFHLVNGIGRPGANTAFMVVGTSTTYGLLLALSFGGLTVTRFALAASASLLVNGIAYLIFAEWIVWGKWLAPSVPVVERRSVGTGTS
jgi:O-antigen/teichoic acid export membrane protein